MTGRAVQLRTTRGDRKSEIPEPFAGYGGSKRRDDRPRHHQTSEELLGVTMTKGWRSEEHTSELQSLMRISYAVFCLTKKKLTKYTAYIPCHYMPIHMFHTHTIRS